MKVCLIQMNSTDDRDSNLEQAAELLSTAIEAAAPDLVCLPELFTYLGGTEEGARASAEKVPGGAAYTLLQDTARRYGVAVHGGSINELAGDRCYNTSLVFDGNGEEIARYRKIHLFDVTTPDGKTYRESATYAAGEQVVSGELSGVSFGCTICYDLRFPELYSALANSGVKIIFAPAAFTAVTGQDHWEILCRARAVETQCYVLAANQTGPYVEDGVPRASFGHSMVVDPWGKVLASCGDEVGYCAATLDFEYLERVRAELPSLRHRVLDRRTA